MNTQTQAWLRAELIAAPESTFGPQLMIPADGLEFHDTQLVFHHQGEVVYVVEQGQLRSVTWCTKLPNPEFERRKAQWPKHGTRWTEEEREDLKRRLVTGQSWSAISKAHGRTRSGVQQEAVKQGWVFPDSHNPTPELLAARLLAADPAPTASVSSSADEPPTPSTDASPPDTAESPSSAADAIASESPSAADQPQPEHSTAPTTTDSAPTPDPGATASIPNPRAEPTPGIRTRAQSSLARVTLGAYVNAAKPTRAVDT